MDFNTVIYEGDVEWSYYEEQNSWAAFISSDNALSPAGQIIITFDGEEYDAVFMDVTTYGLYKNGDMIAMFIMQSDTSFILTSLSEPTDPHVKIVQEDTVSRNSTR